jgi:hypothetical protein
MQTNDIQQLREQVNRIINSKFDEKIPAQNPSSDLSQKRFTNFSASEFIAFTQRLCDQFLAELDGADAAHWCRGYYWETPQHGMSHRHIIDVVRTLANNCENNQWDSAAQHLELAIGYQITHGFWNRAGRKYQSLAKLRQQEIFSDLEAKSHQLRVLIQEIQGLKDQQSHETARRQNDAQEAANQLAAIKKNAEEVTRLLNKSNGENGQLTQIVASQTNHLEKSEANLTEIEKAKTILYKTQAEAAEKLQRAVDLITEIQAKERVVNEIAGTAAAGILGQKFEARMRQLAKASNWWLGGTVFSVVLGAAWLGIAHKYFIQSGSDFMLTLALNFGLLLPALFIVGFFAKQFGKVRHFEEEYAFRSSVAMTLGAFADKLSGTAGEKDKLITETVEKLYRLPVLLQEKESHGWFSQRSTERMVKATTELVSAVKRPPGA